MIDTMFGAVTALNAAATVSAVTANNIANLKTPSYKSNSAFLSELNNGGVKLSNIRPNNNQGSLIPTNEATDIAVFGNGSKEELYSTYSYVANKFSIDDFGNFRGPAGELLFTGAGGNVRLDNEGNLYSENQLIGTITPTNGNQDFEPTGFSILSGYMVSSNVNISDEMVTGMVNQRFLEVNTAVIKTADEMLGTVINMKA